MNSCQTAKCHMYLNVQILKLFRLLPWYTLTLAVSPMSGKLLQHQQFQIRYSNTTPPATPRPVN